MKLLSESHIVRSTSSLNETGSSGTRHQRKTRGRAPRDHASKRRHAKSEALIAGGDAEGDSYLAQYFGDVRQHALLTRAQEDALWQRIERLKRRERQALYTSPICLPTLQTLWRQVQCEALPLGQVVANEMSHPEAAAQFKASLAALQKLSARLRGLRNGAGASRQKVRKQRAALWRQWIRTCEGMAWCPEVDEELRLALENALQDAFAEPVLQAVHRRWQRARQALEEAKDRMLRANLRLVIYVAKQYRSEEVPFLDLIQEGNIGLMRALEKFEPSRGLKFVTYAHWWVRQAIGRAIIEQRSSVRLPSYVVERKNKLHAAEAKLWQVYQQAPNAQQLAVEMGSTPEEVKTLQDTRHVMLRLHEPVTEDGRKLDEAVADRQALELDEAVAQSELQQRMAECLNHLPEREATILRLRFGLGNDHSHTLTEIGQRYGLSRERIRQLERTALTKLRKSEHCTLLTDFIDVA